MRYCLDIPSTATLMPFNSQPEAVAEMYRTKLDCAVYRGDDCIAEGYMMEGDDGEYFMEYVMIEDAEYVEL